MKWGGQKLDWPCTQHGSREISWKDQYSRRGQRKMMKKTNVVVIAALCEHGSLGLAGLQTGGDANSIFNPQRKSVCAVDRRDISTFEGCGASCSIKKKKSQMTAVDEKWWRRSWRYINDDMGRPALSSLLPSKCQDFFFLFTPKRDKSVNIWIHGCTGQWRENNQFSSWAGFIDKFSANQNMHGHWLLAFQMGGGGGEGCSAACLIGYLQTWLHSCSHELPFTLRGSAVKYCRLNCQKAKHPLAFWPQHSTSIKLVLMFCRKGSSLMLQYLTFKGLSEILAIGELMLIMRKTAAKTTPKKSTWTSRWRRMK